MDIFLHCPFSMLQLHWHALPDLVLRTQPHQNGNLGIWTRDARKGYYLNIPDGHLLTLPLLNVAIALASFDQKTNCRTQANRGMVQQGIIQSQSIDTVDYILWVTETRLVIRSGIFYALYPLAFLFVLSWCRKECFRFHSCRSVRKPYLLSLKYLVMK